MMFDQKFLLRLVDPDLTSSFLAATEAIAAVGHPINFKLQLKPIQSLKITSHPITSSNHYFVQILQS